MRNRCFTGDGVSWFLYMEGCHYICENGCLESDIMALSCRHEEVFNLSFELQSSRVVLS